MFIDEISLKIVSIKYLFSDVDIHAHGQHILNFIENPQ